MLGNVYLSSLDAYVEKELVGKNLRYFRYADDITLMGKNKEDVLKATEKIVRFLREQNLTLNEKTKLAELPDTKIIEAMRFFSDYDEDDFEIPEDEFTRIQNKVPEIISSIKNGEAVEKLELGELKYFLKIDTTYDCEIILKLIEIIPLRPSLTVLIVKYVSEGRNVLNISGDSMDSLFIDSSLWETYKKTDVSEWSRFWIFKLLVSNKNVIADGVDKEIEKILSSKENTIFKIVCFYYQTIQERKIDIEQVKQAMDDSKTDMEKSLYSFFLLNAFQGVRDSVIKNCIEKPLDSSSHELNLIGSYLFKNKPKISLNDFEGIFSGYLLKKKTKREKVATKNIVNEHQQDFYLVRKENLISIDSPSELFGVNRPKEKKRGVELIFPEPVRWEKVTIKIKEGLQDVEILYDDESIKTTDYIKLGLSAAKKNHTPNREWQLLCILATLQNKIDTIDSKKNITNATPNELVHMFTRNGRMMKPSTVHTIKKRLSKNLEDIFETKDDPFRDDIKEYYCPKFIVILESSEIWSDRVFRNQSQEPNQFVDESTKDPYEDNENTT